MHSLKNDFPKHTVMATLQCAGNRRVQLIEFAPVPGEVPWREGAIGNATWAGVQLKEILKLAGVLPEARFVEFMGAEDVFRNGKNVGFGASIPIDKAITDDVLLAYEMNGKPLEPTHGFPLRSLVPGYIGARSVKWLTTITLLKEPSKNYFQDHAYRLFPPDAKPETVDWETGEQLSKMNVNCVITEPQQDEIFSTSDVMIKGFAVSGSLIKQVEVSTDGGKTWQPATITDGNEKWAWTFWEIRLQLEAGTHEIIARTIDAEKNVQPEDVKEVWNFKGYMNNAWHRIRITVQ